MTKQQVRQSKEWKELKAKISHKFNDKDPITDKKLYRGWNCHHLNMNDETYDDLNPELFLPLNKSTHEVIHWIFRYYRKDKNILKRLKKYLDIMYELN